MSILDVPMLRRPPAPEDVAEYERILASPLTPEGRARLAELAPMEPWEVSVRRALSLGLVDAETTAALREMARGLGVAL